MFDITKADIGRYIRRISTGEVSRVRKDPGNGWLHTGLIYEWMGYRDDFEYVAVVPLREPIQGEVKDPITIAERVQDIHEGRVELRAIMEPEVISAIYDSLIAESAIYRDYLRIRSEQALLRSRNDELTRENARLLAQLGQNTSND